MVKDSAKVHTESAAEMETRLRKQIMAELAGKAAPVKQTRAQAAAELKTFLAGLGEKPRYQLMDKAYIDDILYDPELKPWVKDSEPPVREPLVIAFMGRPGPHMVPKNKAAEMMYAKYPPSNLNPIDELSIVGEEGTDALRRAVAVG